MSSEYLFHCNQREVRKVLMIDRIVLVLLHKSAQMRELQRGNSFRLKQNSNAADKIVKIRDLCQDIVANYQVRCLSAGNHLLRGMAPEELDKGGHPLFLSRLGDVCCGLDAEDGNSFFQKILQQITVVAGQFDRKAPWSKVETLGDHVDI